MDLTERLSTGAWLGVGAVLGVIAGCWDKVKAAVWRFFNLFIVRVELDSAFTKHTLVSYLVVHFRRSNFYDRVYAAWNEMFRDGRCGLIACEQLGDRTLLFWHGWRPFLVSQAKLGKGEGEKDRKAAAYVTF